MKLYVLNWLHYAYAIFMCYLIRTSIIGIILILGLGTHNGIMLRIKHGIDE